MAMIIDHELCICCGACLAACPVEAIEEREDKIVLNPDLCLDCGACLAACPMGAISES